MLLRIALAIGLLSGAAVIALNIVQVRPRLVRLQAEKAQLALEAEHFAAEATKERARAARAEEQWTMAEEELARFRPENQELRDQTSTIADELHRTSSELHSARQALARWDATGVSPSQVRTLAKTNKALMAQVANAESTMAILRQELDIFKTALMPFVDHRFSDGLPVTGTVVAVDPKWQFVVLDLGPTQAIWPNRVLLVGRGGKLVGKVQVVRVQEQRCIANILPQWRVADIVEGDQVLN